MHTHTTSFRPLYPHLVVDIRDYTVDFPVMQTRRDSQAGKQDGYRVAFGKYIIE